jgi:hypothetical protein
VLELEGLLQDERLKDEDRHALHGAQQALRNVLDPATWHPGRRYRAGLAMQEDRKIAQVAGSDYPLNRKGS